MLLDAIITILRETLEAGVLVSVLASLGSRLQLSLHWLWSAFGIGLLGALLYAWNLRIISEWFDGVGQEVTKALLQYVLYLLLLGVLVGLSAAPRSRSLLRLAMIAAVALAISREGLEILLFFSSYMQSEAAFMRALTSSFVSLMIGLSIGISCYYALTIMLPPRLAGGLQCIVLPLIAAGMALQATQLLIQADWLPAGATLWDSSRLLPEQSIGGQMAYAVFGYEARPTATEMVVYVGALLLISITLGLYAGWRQRTHP